MYSKSSVKSYARGTKSRKSFRNPIPPGLVEGAGWTAGAKLADVIAGQASELRKSWRKGKKSKLGKSLSNPKKKKLHYGPGDNRDELQDYLNKEDKKDLARRIREDEREKETERIHSLMHSSEYKKLEGMYLEAYEPWGGTKPPYQGVMDDARKFALKKLGVKNPNPGQLDDISPEVEDLSKQWHGREVQDYSEVEEVESFDEDVVDIGALEELGIWGLEDKLFTISFKRDRPTVVCDGEGHNLEVVGGDQELDLKGQGVEHKGKRLIPIGYIYSIVYETDKHHLEGSSGYPEPYEHYFAEEVYKKSLDPEKYENTDDWFKELCDMGVPQKCIEKGLLPTAVYNQTDGKIMIAGGNYEVTELGIRD